MCYKSRQFKTVGKLTFRLKYSGKLKIEQIQSVIRDVPSTMCVEEHTSKVFLWMWINYGCIIIYTYYIIYIIRNSIC